MLRITMLLLSTVLVVRAGVMYVDHKRSSYRTHLRMHVINHLLQVGKLVNGKVRATARK